MIKVYMHYLKLKDFMNHEPVVVKTSFSSAEDIETFIRLKDVLMRKQENGMIIKKRTLREKLMFWKKSLK